MIRRPPDRPLWQRLLLPLCGLGMVLVGLCMFLFPAVPGFWLMVLGAPLLFAYSAPSEAWAQSRLLRGLGALRGRMFRAYPALRERAHTRRAKKHVARGRTGS